MRVYKPIKMGLAGVCLAMALPLQAGAWDTNEWQFLESIERANFRFFQDQKRGPYDLLNDTAYYDSLYNYPSYSSVAGIGFELTAICLGHYRGWIPYSNAYEQVLSQLKLFNGMLSTNALVGERVNGWTWHTYWIEDSGTNMAGTRFYMDDGLSLLDHSLFMGGCIFVSEYFKGTEAGDLAHKLYSETTWSWRPNSDYNFGYSENLLAVVESAAAPAFAKGSEARVMWESYDEPYPRTLQLYFWQYPHAWIDFRFRWDGRGRNHAEIARDSILYQRQRAIELHDADPAKYDMLGSNCWGWTAAGSSDGYRQMAPWPLWLGSYYDEEHASDSGSITPIGLPGAMIYAGTETMACMKNIFEKYYINGWDMSVGERPVWSEPYGWLNCMNKGRPWRYYSDSGVSNHFHGINAAIDYGPNVLLLENYKLGTTWRWFMQNPYIATGMYTIGFGAPQNVNRATFTNGVNEFGGSVGHWENDATPVNVSFEVADFTNAYVGDEIVRIVADNSNEGGWIDLNNSDQRGQAQLSFWTKCSSAGLAVDVGLKDQFGRENKVSLADFAGGVAPTNWMEIRIPIERFCLTGNVTNDVWPGSLALVSFAFLNEGGGTIELDSLAFTSDTIPPVMPTNSFGVAMAENRARVSWSPSNMERDVLGYHVWRRYTSTSGFVRASSTIVPAYLGVWEDTNVAIGVGQEVRYAIQAFDNAEPQHSSPFTLEKKAVGGHFDLDWNNGVNLNTLGGSGDNYWGGGTPQSFTFVYTNGPAGTLEWVRRSYVTSPWGGHYIDCADRDVSAYWGLSFWIRGKVGGEQILLGLKDSSDRERKLDADLFLSGGSVATSWSRVILPFSDFTNVSVNALRQITITHETSNDIQLADIAFIPGQQSVLVNDHWREAEACTRESGAGDPDYKAAASAGEVLGNGWGMNGGNYADYEFYLDRVLSTPTLFLRYACAADDGRAFEVRWDDANIGSITCTNTGGWGTNTNHFSWATVVMPSLTSGAHKLTFVANGYDAPVNLDAWYLLGVGEAFRECEDYDSQVGSSGPDVKTVASGGEVLGNSWGASAASEAVYNKVDCGSQTGAWFHLWYALYAPSGRVVDVYVDGVHRASLSCAGTRGWGSAVADFDRASAFVGELDGSSHAVRLAVPGGGQAINLDCFYIGPAGPEGFALDGDGDGLSDREEGVMGTGIGTPDSDGDGISDGDEVQFGTYGQVTDPTKADTDGDGSNDREEWIAGTDANAEDSIFQCLEILDEDFPRVGKVVRWPSTTGRVYNIYAVTNLLTSDLWLLTSGIPSTPTMNVWTDAVSRDNPMIIYRIDVHR